MTTGRAVGEAIIRVASLVLAVASRYTVIGSLRHAGAVVRAPCDDFPDGARGIFIRVRARIGMKDQISEFPDDSVRRVARIVAAYFGVVGRK